MPFSSIPSFQNDTGTAQLQRLHEALLKLQTLPVTCMPEDDVLRHGIESLTALIGVRYGAIAILEGDGIRQFISTGLAAATASRIGHPPRGQGLLTAITDTETLRLDDISRDPRFTGFPLHHPPMKSLLAVPIAQRNHHYGHFLLSEKTSGESFDDNDEILAKCYADTFALLIACHRAEAAQARASNTLQEVSQALSGTSGDNFLPNLVLNLSRVLGVDYVFVGEPVPKDPDVIRTIAFCDHGSLVDNIDYHLHPDTPCGRVESSVVCHFPDNARTHYSGDELIRCCRAEAFIGHPLFDSAGQVIGLLVAMHGKAIADKEHIELVLRLCADRAAAEVERRRASETMRESEERFSATFSQAAVGIAHVALDGRFLRVNQKFCDILGYTQAEVLERTFQGLTHLEDLEANRESDRRILAGEISTCSTERRYYRKDGSLVWANLTVSVVRDLHGPKYVISVIEDISARKAAELHMRELSSVIEQTADSVVITDRRGIIQYVNPAHEAVTGYARDETIGKSLQILDRGQHDKAFFDRMWTTILDGRAFRDRFINRKKDGSLYYEEKTITPLKSLDGHITHFVSTGKDITERVLAEEALRTSEERFRGVVQNIPLSIHTIDSNGRITSINHAGLYMLGATKEDEVCGTEMLASVSEPDRARIHGLLNEALQGTSCQFQFVTITGRNFDSQLIPVKDRDGQIQYLLGVTEDITEHRETRERLHYLAHYDPLTGLPNRILLQDRLSQAMLDARRRERMVALLFLDLDRFKIINDTLGHEMGDALLREVASRLTDCVRAGDTIARLGGDEFTVVLANIAHVDDAARLAQKLIDSFMPPFLIGGREMFISASIGITLYPFDDSDLDSLLRNADAAMYHAKELGRNTFQFYTTELNRRTVQRLQLETALRHTLDRNELTVYYQPQVDFATGKITGAEALLRWRHPEMGLVPPLKFIPLAEETGLIIPIGEWVLRTACRQAQAWRIAGFHNFRIAVNLSGRQFQNHNLAKVVEAVLKETGLDPLYLDLELTESILLHNTNETLATMKRLHGLGVVFTMDDFGTGYSSLSYLKRFPIDALKIDRSFVRDIPTDPNDAAIAQAIIAMAHSLGIRVIAEGVETSAQRAFMRTHRCDGMQGYHFSKPLSSEKMTRLLQRNHRVTRSKASSDTGNPLRKPTRGKR